MYKRQGTYLSKVPYLPQGISSIVKPAANIAETKAIGNPVAFDAKADEMCIRDRIKPSYAHHQ